MSSARILPLVLLSACSQPLLDAGSPTPWDLPLEEAGPPAGWLTLSAGPLVAGAAVTLEVSGAPPRSTVLLARSTQGLGPGPCPVALQGGCLDLLPPVTFLSLTARADAAGHAVFRPVLPAALAGQTVTLQAAVVGREAWLSNPIDRAVASTPIDPALDSDGDGATVLTGDCAEGRADIHPGAADPLGDGRDLDCNDLDGATQQIAADATGGTWQLAEGGSLTLPAGALVGPTTLEVIPIHPPSWMAAADIASGGSAVRLRPDGLQLAAPLTLRLPLSAAALTRSDEELGLGFSADRLRGAAVPATIDRGASLVVAELAGPGEATAAQVGLDRDGDGAVDVAAGGTDCDDQNASVHPNAAETCGDGDQDCDGEDERYIALDGTGDLGCAVDHLGAVSCWGTDVTPPPGGPFDDVRMGALDICARTPQGMWTCVGSLGIPDGAWTELSLDTRSAVAIDGAGQLHTWGPGLANPPAGTFLDVDTGLDIACAIDAAHAVVCFGANLTPSFSRWQPTGTFTRVTMDRRGVAAVLTTQGDVISWGRQQAADTLAGGPFIAPSLCYESLYSQACGIDAAGQYTCDGGGCASPRPPAAFLSVQDDGGCTLGIDGALRCRNDADRPPPLRQPWTTSEVALRQDGTPWIPLEDGSGLSPYLVNLPAPAVRIVSWVHDNMRVCALTEAGEIGCGTYLYDNMPPMMLAGGPFDDIITYAQDRTDVLCGHAVATDTWVCTGDRPRGLLSHLQPGDSAPAMLDDHTCGSTCVLDRLGRVRCWDHASNAVDTGGIAAICPGQPPSGVFADLAVSRWGYWAGLRPSGEVEVWGGMRGNPLPPIQHASAIASGDDVCFGDDASVWRCWNTHTGQWDADVPSVPLHAVEGYFQRTCGLDAANHQHCWGDTSWEPRTCDPLGW